MEYEEDQEEEEQENEISLNPSYDGGSARPPPPKLTSPSATPPPPLLPPRKSRYRECLKNHAVTIGGHATDGCGEFIAAGDDGTLDSLKCAACNCHRNFHRKDAADAAAFFPFPHPQQQMLLYHRTAPRAALLALPSSSGGGGSREEAEEYNYYSTPGSQKKRFRTKFSGEQKEKMLDLAERLGWKIQKQDEELVQHFCYEMGIKRHVLKVWMHNNKHTLGKKT